MDSSIKGFIQNQLKKIAFEGGDYNFLTFNLTENYYMQVLSAKDSHELLLEAVSNEFLESESKLNSATFEQFHQLGWSDPNKNHENHFIVTNIISDDSLRKWVDVLLRTANDIYGVKEVTEEMIEIHLGNSE